MSDMSLAEKHARVRAQDDVNTVLAADQFVVDYFGGDYQRAAWFLDELANMEGGRSANLYSVRAGAKVPAYFVKDN